MGKAARAALLAASLLAALVAGLAVGPTRAAGAREALDFLAGRSLPPVAEAVLRHRLARTAAAMIVGAALAASGSGLQAVLRNPLADPYLLGISSGAALAVLLAVAAGAADPAAVGAAAFAGGMAAFALTMAASALAGASPTVMVVAGVAVGYVAWSLAVIVMARLGPQVEGGFYWLFGSVAYTTPGDLEAYTPPILAALALLALRAGRVEKLILGEEVAESLGARVSRTRMEVALAAGLAASSAVSLAGPIGFVGLTAPWIARAAVGNLYTRLLPASAAAGAALLAFSDVAARAAGPGELPLTAVTSLAGAPLMVYVMHKLRGARE